MELVRRVDALMIMKRASDAISAKLKFRKSQKRALSQRHFIFRGHFCVVFLPVAALDLEIDPYLPGRLGLQAQVVGRLGARGHGQFTFVVRNDFTEDLRFRPSIGQCYFHALVLRFFICGELVLDGQLRIQGLFY